MQANLTDLCFPDFIRVLNITIQIVLVFTELTVVFLIEKNFPAVSLH